MQAFFGYDYTGEPFIFFGTAHIAALLCIIALNIFLLRYKHKDESTRKKVRITMAAILWVNEAAWHVWSIATGTWSIQEHLPLHACSILIWLSGFMLYFKNYRIYEFIYFIGIAGALQALLTPNIGIYGYPHFRFFQTYISHGLLVTSAVYMTTVEGMRPTWKSLLRVMIITNLYMGVVFGINQLIGSNYLYVAHKPPGPTLLDALPAWPWYLLYMEALGLVMFLLLYLPFAIQDWRQKTRISQASGS
jgi:hypothetical integral membrane protein (TIGR02206 family)